MYTVCIYIYIYIYIYIFTHTQPRLGDPAELRDDGHPGGQPGRPGRKYIES